MQLSYNKLQTFGECALKYRFAYIERLPRPPIAALAFHRRLHAALAKYHFFARRDGVVREEELLAAYADICEVSRNPETQETKQYREGKDILQRYCQAENQKGRVPAYLEHTLTFAFGPYTLTGKIDRIDFTNSKSYSIVDYNLDRQLPKENAAEASRQLSFYQLLVSEGLGVEAEDVRLYFLRHGVEQVSCRSRLDMRATVEWIDATAGAIHREKRWQPSEGNGCRTCAFQQHCPAKTGQERAAIGVWQQGSLLWEINDTSEETASLASSASSATPSQTTLDFS